MAVTTYTSFLGRVVREDRGGTVRDYGQDTLGSTAALYDEAGTKTDELHYWPYGEVRSHTGSSATPLTFVGTLGYFMDAASRYYVRARSYRADLGRWTTVDPLWPGESAYGYAGGNPTTRTDPSGMGAVQPDDPGGCTPQGNQEVISICFGCYYQPGGPTRSCVERCDAAAAAYYDGCLCSKGNKPAPPSAGRAPGPWFPIPGLGVVPPPAFRQPIVPVPPIAPPSMRPAPRPVFRPGPTRPEKRPIPSTCVAEATGNGSWYYFDLDRCIACAQRSGADPAGCKQAADQYNNPINLWPRIGF
jgi:RHS repeat-associated protein